MAAAAAEAEAEAAARRSFVDLGREYTTERDIQKAAWEAGAAASVASGPPPGQRQNADDEPNIPEVEKLATKGGDKGEGHYAKGGGAGASGVSGVSVSIGSISRETSGVSSFSSNSRGYPVSHGAFGQGSRSISSGSAGGREGSKKLETISTTRSKGKDGDEPGQTGVRVGSGKGWNGAAGSVEGSGVGGGGYKRAPVPTVEAPAASRFDLAGFVSWLDGGVLLTKINRQGRAKVRTLFYDEQNRMLWWNGPGASGRLGSGSQRSRSSSLMSLRKEQPLPLASLIEVGVVFNESLGLGEPGVGLFLGVLFLCICCCLTLVDRYQCTRKNIPLRRPSE